MKSVSPALAGILFSSNVQYRANLYTITLSGQLAGTTLYLTDGDQNLTVGGHTYACDALAGDPGMMPEALPANLTDTYVGTSPYGVVSRSRSRASSDLSIDDVDVTLSIGVLANGLGVPVNALIGSFDGCDVTIGKCFMSTYGDAATNGAVLDVVGKGYPADISSTVLRLSVKAATEQLSMPLPRRLVQANCPWTFCGLGCGLSLASFTTACTCAAGSTASSLVLATGAATYASAYGYVEFTSGALAGLRRSIATTGAPVKLAIALPSAPAVGDAFKIIGGCNRTRAGATGDFAHDCTAYGNLPNFGGFSDTPAAALSED